LSNRNYPVQNHFFMAKIEIPLHFLWMQGNREEETLFRVEVSGLSGLHLQGGIVDVAPLIAAIEGVAIIGVQRRIQPEALDQVGV